MITLRVDGEPAPQGSKSVGRHGGVYEKSRKVGPWRNAIVAAYRLAPQGTLDGPLRVNLAFRLPRPKSHLNASGNLRASAPVRPATRPDLDKLIRSTLDGLKQAGAYGDDGQVVELYTTKDYAMNGDTGVDIHIAEVGS